MTAAEQVGGDAVAGDAPAAAPVAHEMKVGPSKAFDSAGVVRSVWSLVCSCGHAGQAIDKSGITREARLHTLEIAAMEQAQMIATLFAVLEGMGAMLEANGLRPPEPPTTPMPEPPTEPVEHDDEGDAER